MKRCWMGEGAVERRVERAWIAFSEEAFSWGVEADAYWARDAWMEFESSESFSIEGSKGGGAWLGAGCEFDILRFVGDGRK